MSNLIYDWSSCLSIGFGFVALVIWSCMGHVEAHVGSAWGMWHGAWGMWYQNGRCELHRACGSRTGVCELHGACGSGMGDV